MSQTTTRLSLKDAAAIKRAIRKAVLKSLHVRKAMTIHDIRERVHGLTITEVQDALFELDANDLIQECSLTKIDGCTYDAWRLR